MRLNTWLLGASALASWAASSLSQEQRLHTARFARLHELQGLLSPGLRHGNVFDTVRDLGKRYEQVVVDAGGRDSEELRTALVASHVVYCPLKASQPDLETSVHMNELVKLARGMNQVLQARLVISMGPTNPAIHEAQEARELLAELTEFKLSEVVIRDRKVYRDAMAEGRGVIEMSNEKAKDEIEAIAKEIYQIGDEA
jgi:chromosome partitioning protein